MIRHEWQFAIVNGWPWMLPGCLVRVVSAVSVVSGSVRFGFGFGFGRTAADVLMLWLWL